MDTFALNLKNSLHVTASFLCLQCCSQEIIITLMKYNKKTQISFEPNICHSEAVIFHLLPALELCGYELFTFLVYDNDMLCRLQR